jgi:hypothetical protein
VGVEPRRDRPLAVVGRRVRRDRNRGDSHGLLLPLVVTPALNQRVAVLPRHADVGEQDMRRLLPHRAPSIVDPAVARGRPDRRAGPKSARVALVNHDEDFAVPYAGARMAGRPHGGNDGFRCRFRGDAEGAAPPVPALAATVLPWAGPSAHQRQSGPVRLLDCPVLPESFKTCGRNAGSMPCPRPSRRRGT